MGIENKSTENLESQNTGGLKSSSLEAQQNVVNTQEKVHKLVKINTFLESIDDTKEDQYEKTLLKLDKDSLTILLNKPQAEILQLLQKSDSELQANLIQAQIDELEVKGNLTKDEKRLRYNLRKELIATKDSTIVVEKQETENNDNLIAQEKLETQKAYSEVSDKLASIEGSLSILKGRNRNIEKIFELLKSADQYKVGPNASVEEIENGADKMNEALQQIVDILKNNPLVLKSIVDDLKEEDEKNGTDNLGKFRATLIELDPNFEWQIDGDFAGNLAKAKLGTTDLSGVDLGSNVLSKTEDGVTTSYSKDEGRYLSSTGEGKYKIKSELNPKYEEEIIEINSATKEKLAPLNENLNLVSKILEYLKNARQNGEDFEEVKKSIQEQNPEFYAEEGLDNVTSFDEMMMILNARKYELEEKKEEIKSEAIERMDELLRQNQEEIDSKEKHKKEMLKFFSTIGFDRLSQTETDKLIELVNLNPGSYGLDGPIDLENGDLGFNKDFGDKRISPTEKLAFVKFFNKMLGEDVVRVDEKLQTIIPLDSSDENKLQKLSNKKVGFFMGNLDKESTSNESQK